MAGESKLQRKIIQDLKKSGWIALKIILCNLPGFNDIVGFKDKKTIFIEVKDKDEKPKHLQIYRHNVLRSQGFDVFVVDSWEEYVMMKNNNL